MKTHSDEYLSAKIEELKLTIENWATEKDLWWDSGFKSYFEHYDDEPEEHSPIVLVMWSEGGIYDVLNGNSDLYDEFYELIKATDFAFEKDTEVITVFYAEDKLLNQSYKDYFEWQWICRLIQPDYTSLYDEIYSHFKTKPETLYNLSPRQFEIFLSEVFRNQGYYTELGPGWSDGGVDIKIYKKDEIDQIVTLVQAKKYKDSLPIGLESVTSLSAIVDDQKANRGLFVTTSRFLPVAKNFADRQNKKLILATKEDISKWCENVSTKIIKDKSILISDEYIKELISTGSSTNLEGKIVHARTGYNCIMNTFCLILKDSFSACLLMEIPSVKTKSFDPPHNFRGEEVPILDERILKNKTKEKVFRASKNIKDNGEIYLWGNKTYFSLWDEKPKYFDLLD